MIGEVVRTRDEISELCQEIREHQEGKSAQFVELTFEEGVQAAIKWLFFNNEPYPADVKPVKKAAHIMDVPQMVHADSGMDND
jgi:PhoPQ-activated pathogenicity-related protein